MGPGRGGAAHPAPPRRVPAPSGARQSQQSRQRRHNERMRARGKLNVSWLPRRPVQPCPSSAVLDCAVLRGVGRDQAGRGRPGTEQGG